MTRELVALMAATLDITPDVSDWSETRTVALVHRARTLLAEVQRQGVDSVRMDVRCDTCGRSVANPITYMFDARQWTLMLHRPTERRCGHNEAPLRFVVDFLEAEL